MPARALMLQGTGSGVGKSVLVAGLARALVRRGLSVAPFKPQNMSNNATVAADGGEIGRAQALQARACGRAPITDMNPVLLKPQSETGAQVVVQGRVVATARAREYQAMKPALLPRVLESFGRLREACDLVLVEGAGSASEINLRAGDIANMGFARAAGGVPVVIVGDIDRGGVIAALAGTRAVLAAEDAALVAGFLVNRMRGDVSLFAEGMRLIERHTGWPALGLIPHLDAVRALPAEDAADLDDAPEAPRTGAALRIVVPLLPWIANFDDLDPLRAETDVALHLARPGAPLPRGDVIVLPGSKATRADLDTLRAEGWDIDIVAHARAGGAVLGLCGGYQMLGRTIADPEGIEGPPGDCTGLGLLDVETVLIGDKRLERVRGTLAGTDAAFDAYEMHVGRTGGSGTARPFARLADGRTDGAVSPDGRVAGTYLHGLFTADTARRAWLRARGATPGNHAHAASVEAALDALAAHLETHVDVDRLLSLAR
jgi:adenosylcobyric acid synthase